MKAFAKIAVVLGTMGTVTAIHADSTVPVTATPSTAKSDAPTVAEMQATAARLSEQMKSDLEQVTELKEVARKQKDVIKLNCVNDRLIQIKAQLNIADATNVQLQASLSRNADDRQSLYASLSGTAESVKNLRGEADSCIGAPDLMKQEASGNTVDRPFIPDDPATTPTLGEEFEPPAYGSPFD